MSETGTTSEALVYVAPGEGEQMGLLGEGLRMLLSASLTQTPLSLLEISSPPGGGPPALHTHPPMETFYILEGRYEFSQIGCDGPTIFLAEPGSVVHIPGGAPHNYRNVSDTTGRMLGIFTSQAMEGFFRDMSAATTDASGEPIFPPDMGKLFGIMGRYDIAFVGGGPGQDPR